VGGVDHDSWVDVGAAEALGTDQAGSSEPPTVIMVGEGSLARAGEFLRLGAVLVIAPDRPTLRAWEVGERVRPPERFGQGHDPELDVDLRSRRIRFRAQPLDLTELEFRVMAALAAEPGRAWSYGELRCAGWGGGLPPSPDDVHTVRSVIQRLRRRLRDAAVPRRIQSVRRFGYRLETAHVEERNIA
jgi:hypothetical protein